VLKAGRFDLEGETGEGLRDLLLPEALRAYRRLSKSYVDQDGLRGPDEAPFTRNARLLLPFYPIYRVLAALGFLHYPRYRHVQGQAYWILANLFLHKQMQATEYLDSAVAAGAFLVRSQNPDGSWDYPLPGWTRKISSVYGLWGGLSLVKLYNATRDDQYLEAALRWKKCLTQKVGINHYRINENDLEFISYFYPAGTNTVPNASTLALAFLSNLGSDLSDGDERLMIGLLKSIQAFQLPTGEIAYTQARVHYQCQNYNAFEFIDLFEFARNTESQAVIPILKGVADFLARGVSREGQVGYSCTSEYPEITYHTLIVASALHYAYLLFADQTYANFRNSILGKLYRRTSSLLTRHAIYKLGPIKVSDRAFFARQAAYCLLSFLRLSEVSRIEFLDSTLF
jgi:hypothetical protein